MASRNSPNPAVLKGCLSYGVVLVLAFMPAVAIIHTLRVVKNMGTISHDPMMLDRYIVRDEPKTMMATPMVITSNVFPIFLPQLTYKDR